MTDFQVLTCPNCGGRGCPTCNNTGKVKVQQDQLQKLKQMVDQLPQNQLQSQPQSFDTYSPTPVSSKPTAGIAGIISFSLLAILAGAGTASWYFLKTLKPFFSALLSLIILVGTRLASKHPFFSPKEPHDFLSAIKAHSSP